MSLNVSSACFKPCQNKTTINTTCCKCTYSIMILMMIDVTLNIRRSFLMNCILTYLTTYLKLRHITQSSQNSKQKKQKIHLHWQWLLFILSSNKTLCKQLYIKICWMPTNKTTGPISE